MQENFLVCTKMFCKCILMNWDICQNKVLNGVFIFCPVRVNTSVDPVYLAPWNTAVRYLFYFHVWNGKLSNLVLDLQQLLDYFLRTKISLKSLNFKLKCMLRKSNIIYCVDVFTLMHYMALSSIPCFIRQKCFFEWKQHL